MKAVISKYEYIASPRQFSSWLQVSGSASTTESPPQSTATGEGKAKSALAFSSPVHE
jgi:hypothetical protein